jgi:hypothetical protein
MTALGEYVSALAHGPSSRARGYIVEITAIKQRVWQIFSNHAKLGIGLFALAVALLGYENRLQVKRQARLETCISIFVAKYQQKGIDTSDPELRSVIVKYCQSAK